MNLDINIAYSLFGKIEGINDIESALRNKEYDNPNLTNKLNEFLGFYDRLTKKPKRREMMNRITYF